MDEELLDFEFLENFIHNFEALGLGQHQVVLAGYVEILQSYNFQHEIGRKENDNVMERESNS